MGGPWSQLNANLRYMPPSFPWGGSAEMSDEARYKSINGLHPVVKRSAANTAAKNAVLQDRQKNQDGRSTKQEFTEEDTHPALT